MYADGKASYGDAKGQFFPSCSKVSVCMHKVSRDTYNRRRRGMSNIQLNGGPHGAWVGAYRNLHIAQDRDYCYCIECIENLETNNSLINKMIGASLSEPPLVPTAAALSVRCTYIQME